MPLQSFRYILFSALLCLFSLGSVRAEIKVSRLSCEMLDEPMAVEVERPRLSWVIEADERGVMQTSYHILVASSMERLESNVGDLWDSGEVLSDQSHLVEYAGDKLKSKADCYWKVKVSTTKGESVWSKPSKWGMGIFYFNDWYGRWIGFDRAFPWDDDGFHSKLSARYFRKEFEVDKPVKRARVFIMGLGLYVMYFNGSKIGDQVLAPSPTDYHQNVKYNVFDVTHELKNGNNAVGVIVGNGRYHTMRQYYKPYKIKNFGYPSVMLQMEVEYEDGTTQYIRTDNSWKGTANGPLLYNNEYDGEAYDARKEMPGWNKPGFDDSDWLTAEYVSQPDGSYEGQMNPNMKIMESLKPASLTKKEADRYILDLGQNIAGWLKIKVKGHRGDTVTLRFAEVLDENGELYRENLRDALATDMYILKGNGEETWEPRFVYHGFQFVEIKGNIETPDLKDFTGQVVYDALKSTGCFTTSNELINQIYENATWSVKGSYKGMPIDCPQRNERQPWLGDHAASCVGESFMIKNAPLYSKWTDDIAYSQKGEGSISDVAPAFWRYYSDNMTWPGTYLMVADMLYQQYGDKKPIVKHYASMKKWLFYMKERYMTDGYILTKDSYGDWCAPPKTIEEGRGKSANVKHPSKVIATAYFYYYLGLMEKFARLSGNDSDIEPYKMLAAKVRNGFNERFYNVEQKGYGNNTLTENLLALRFNIVEKENKTGVINSVIHIIEVENKGHLSTGLIGTQWLLRTLSDIGRPDIAIKLATNTTYPSWGYMIENGATSIWELWNGNAAAPKMNSYNHVMMLGDLIIWFYENLAGIKSATDDPGFKTIVMKPDFTSQPDHVSASYTSAYGTIESTWTITRNKLKWDIKVPCNSTALVHIPASSLQHIKENGNRIAEIKSDQIEFIIETDESYVFKVGSGSYSFQSRL